MCWYAHSSNDGLLIRRALKRLLVCEVQVVPDALSPVIFQENKNNL